LELTLSTLFTPCSWPQNKVKDKQPGNNCCSFSRSQKPRTPRPYDSKSRQKITSASIGTSCPSFVRPYCCTVARSCYYTSNMRRGVLIFLIVNLLIISFLVRSVFTLLSLLVEDASADAIRHAELPSPNSSLIEQRPQIIPKIIHQTYKNETIPEVWREAQKSCIDLHPDYEYIVCASIPVSSCLVILTRPPASALDQRKVPPIYQGRISVVPRHV
jgi:hypothetical protein